MTDSFSTGTRKPLLPGDFVQVNTDEWWRFGVGRVIKSPANDDNGQHQVLGVSPMGSFTRYFKREELTRLVPEPEQRPKEWCAEDPFNDHTFEFTTSTAGYDPGRLDNDDLQIAIDNALGALRLGLDFDADDSRVVRCLLEDHLADLLEVQRERAGDGL